MLAINSPQLQTIEDDHLRRIALDLTADLRKAHPKLSAGLPDGHMRGMVETSIHRARALGLNHRRDFRIFAFLHLFVSDRFETAPRPAALLGDERIPPPDRVARMMRVMSEQDWRAVQQETGDAVR